MKNITVVTRLSSVLLAAQALAACGGGGGDSQDVALSMFQALGSVQCTGGGVTLSALQSRLAAAGVQVLAASCGLDGLAHAAACGVPDGVIAIVDVPASQQAIALALNFALLSSLPSAVRAACP